jgi:molybdate transport system ATP-binding protein
MKPLLIVKDITIRVYDSLFFEYTSWQLQIGEQWVIVGPNGAGKSIFAKALAGLLPLKNGEIITKKKIVYLSFDTQQQVISGEERRLDFESVIGKEGQEKTVKEFLGSTYNRSTSKHIFSIDNLLNTSLLSLSTGEMRKIFLIKTLMQNPRILILDEPFDGLDGSSQIILKDIIKKFMEELSVILIVHNKEEIPEEMTHVLLIKNSQITFAGEKEDLLLPNYFSQKNSLTEKIQQPKNKKHKDSILLSLKNVIVRYDNKIVLNRVSWTVRKGENWVVLGPNGAGKSTLINLITGDNQQSYANDITLFGRKKDSGISMWEIKEHIGIISSDLMMKYDKEISSYDVILSGFFDSIGLYKKPTTAQKNMAEEWISKLHLNKIIHKKYQQLSFGQKRMILIARAVVKFPELLIVDEPCHGLDSENRKLVLQMLNAIGESGKTNVILVTHNKAEIIPCISKQLILNRGEVVK